MKRTRLAFLLLLAALATPAAAQPAADGLGGVWGFSPVPSDRSTRGPVQEVTNLPPVTGQGALGICFAHVASTMLTAENCRKLKTDCTTIADAEVFSPLALASAWRRSERKPETPDASASPAPTEGLLVDEGGNAAMVLQVVAYDTGSSPSIECASRRIMTPDYTDETATDRELAMWNRTKAIFKQLHDEAKALDVDCTACVASFESSHAADVAFLTETFPAIGPKKGRSVSALAQPDYGQFLYRLAVPAQCARLSRQVQFESMHKVRVKFYPQPPASTDTAANKGKAAPATGNYRQAIEFIRTSLADQRPLALGQICLDKIPSANKCKNSHEVVIAGLKTTCDAKGRCAEAIKVVNSWGMGWQKANSDGWVDAKTLIDRTFYQAPILTWFVDGQ
ncbi:hypothetical protein PPN31114_00740 [Pandoraea pneumonica]|uniref:Uncharacterized protein n=1 Tax=Pandoraea pneumonica TaxID=2508299 RepID=A0A5E4SCL1_9BURK|nr:hypothetical protein [Pandoraea pneumonica]VVD73596.1 hypothetical protein PPN31114_00740 [Pandoraea pneumonica]